MYSKRDLKKDIAEIGVNPAGTLFVHSSMSAVGKVEGRADTVIDALIEYMSEGLLVLPTHTWSEENNENNVFDPRTEPSCVGILTNLFMKRKGVLRSLHPTHSVAALGENAEEFVAGEESRETPCPRQGCYGKLYDLRAQILFLGCSLKNNTFIHGVEEWNDIPHRLSTDYRFYRIITPAGNAIERPMRYHDTPVGDVSRNYDKLKKPLLEKGIAVKGQIGDAISYLCEARSMADMVFEFLDKDRDLFANNEPVPEEWYTD